MSIDGVAQLPAGDRDMPVLEIDRDAVLRRSGQWAAERGGRGGYIGDKNNGLNDVSLV